MNRLRAPILVDLSGLALVLALWLSALSAPLQASQLRFGLLADAYCGTSLPNGAPRGDGGCHPCCLPAIIAQVIAAPPAQKRLVFVIASNEMAGQTTIAPTFLPAPIRAPPGLA